MPLIAYPGVATQDLGGEVALIDRQQELGKRERPEHQAANAPDRAAGLGSEQPLEGRAGQDYRRARPFFFFIFLHEAHEPPEPAALAKPGQRFPREGAGYAAGVSGAVAT